LIDKIRVRLGVNKMELTKNQIERQDLVDDKCYELLVELAGKELIWNIEQIYKVRQSVQSVIVDDLKLMTENEFYPYMEE
jgi:hypothetical protein